MPLFGQSFEMRPWKSAREIIDWSDLGKSIFNRDKPLSINTIHRIEAGLRKFSGLPFVLPLEGFFRGNQPRSVDDPLPTIVASRGAGSVVQPFILKSYQGSDAASIDAPVPTITAQVEHLGVVNPFLVQLEHSSEASGHDRRVYSPERPLPTVTNRSSIGVVNPFILNIRGGQDGYTRGASVEEPVGALTNHPAQALINPFIVQMDEGGSLQSLDIPLKTMTSADARALVSGLAFLVRYNGVGIGQSVDDPLATMTGKDRFALCVPWVDGVYLLDIYLRMLKPSEMAAAHSFPKSYVFVGSRETKVRQIGNSVPVKLAEALVMSIMDGNL
jgi:DNA (cytosine-5)-methyltransferase 1